MLTPHQLRELAHLLSLATAETSTRMLRSILELLKSGTPEENAGLEELGYVAAAKLMERGEL
jgi:hypothetical protein